MKNYYCLFLLLLMISVSVSAQDKGAIVKQARIGKSNSIYLSGGPAFTFGKNIGDYSKGSNFEMGYTKRLNSVISIGAFGGYSAFKYDPKVTGQGVSYIVNSDPNDWAYTYDQ